MSRRLGSVRLLSILLLAVLVAACSPGPKGPDAALLSTGDKQSSASTSQRSLTFLPNAGQMEPAFLFRTLGSANTLFFTNHEVLLPLPSPQRAVDIASRLLPSGKTAPAEPANPTLLRLRFAGANPQARVSGGEQLPGIVNFFLGNDPAQWHTNVPTYGRIVYEQLYPGIDLLYEGSEGLLKGTFVVAPGANSGHIRWYYDGASRVELRQSELRISVSEDGQTAPLVERQPVAWQTVASQRRSINVRYVIQGDGSIGLALGKYDATQPLLIDPTLDYSTYVGDSACQAAYHMALDPDNNVYITGISNFRNYPSPPDCSNEGYYDIFVTKLDPARTGAAQRVYTTYIGGSDLDIAPAIGVDANGKAYAAGYTFSNNFPTTATAFQRNCPGSGDGVVVQLTATGAIHYASYLGGTKFEELSHAAVANGLTYVAGFTTSTDFPTTANAYQASLRSRDAFVSVLDTSQSGAASLVYSTYYGGTGSDEGYVVDAVGGLIYFAGTTMSTDLPSRNPLQTTNRGGQGYGDLFVAVLDPARVGQNQLLFATYWGGSNDEYPGGVVGDNAGHAYVAGFTASSNFPTTAVSPVYGGGECDAFLVKMDTTTPSLGYSRFVGGSGKDGLREIALDHLGNAYVAGATGSANFPTVNPIQATFRGGVAPEYQGAWFGPGDAVITKFDPTGAMTFGTYLGGTGADAAGGIALDTAGNVYVAGGTRSTDFPIVNAFQTTNAGVFDSFVARIGGRLGCGLCC